MIDRFVGCDVAVMCVRVCLCVCRRMNDRLLQLIVIISVVTTLLSAFSTHAQHLYTHLDHGMSARSVPRAGIIRSGPAWISITIFFKISSSAPGQ